VDHAGSTLPFGVEVERPQALVPRKRGGLMRRSEGAGHGVALGHEQLDEEPAVGHLVAGGGLGEVGELTADRRQAQQPAGGIDRRVGGLFGESR